MQNNEEIKKKIEEECAPTMNERLNDIAIGVATGTAGGAIRGAFTGNPGAVVTSATINGIIGGVSGAIKTNQQEKNCVESALEKSNKQEPVKPAPIIYTPPKPMNVNANYTIAMNANRNKFMGGIGYRF